MSDRFLQRSVQIRRFNASCRRRRIPLKIRRDTSRLPAAGFVLEQTGSNSVVHGSPSESVILFLGLACALKTYKADLGEDVLRSDESGDLPLRSIN